MGTLELNNLRSLTPEEQLELNAGTEQSCTCNGSCSCNGEKSPSQRNNEITKEIGSNVKQNLQKRR